MRQQPQQASQYGSSPLQGVSPSASATYQQQQQQRNPQPVLLEDIEAEMQRQATLRYRMEQNANGNNGGSQKPMSLAEVEAALAAGARAQQQPTPVSQQQQQQPQQQQPYQEQFPPFGYGGQSADPMQMLAMKQQQELMEQMSLEREMKRRQNLRKSQYDGLMTQHDKDVVNRIQLSQLASGDPYMDDFYYQVYSSLRRRAGLPTWQSTHNNNGNSGSNANGSGENGRGRGRREENMMQRMQQQLQRIVNEAKRRPKQTQVSLEGALGKITSLTVRNPRQVLQVSSQQTSEKSTDQHHPPIVSGESKTKVDNKRNVLKIIEDMYTIILELEQMGRQGPPVSREKQDQGDHHHQDEGKQEEREEEDIKEETLDATAAFHEKLVNSTEKLWNALRIAESNDTTPFLISLLSIAKGMKLIPRIFRQLSNDQSLTMLTVIITHFSKLVVCRNVIYPGTAVADVDEAKKQVFVTFDNVELFMNATAPPLLRVIAEAPLSIVIHLFQLLITKNNVAMVAQTKPGLAFLTMLLSRAEILKQGGGVLQGLSAPTPEELAHWQELYSSLFDTLRNRYITTFPSLYYLVPLIPNTPMIQLSLSVDDIYVWQFLAAMAVGASMEQQHILVTEVRDRVMENIVLAKSNRLPLDQASHRIANVNLFLHALGLDASQVSVPM
ncbi:hypothetical protein K501DRAFT_42489 [Backusella circina FSU 941]|nr:hypothetical protein K501DRAFT_42489 [Backusella circina FSU 941]